MNYYTPPPKKRGGGVKFWHIKHLMITGNTCILSHLYSEKYYGGTDWMKYEYLIQYIISWFLLEQ